MTPTSIRRFIWGLTIFVAGIILLLQAYEIVPGHAWRYIWPVFVIIVGLEFMLTSIYKAGEEIEIEIPKFWFKKPALKKAKKVKPKKT